MGEECETRGLDNINAGEPERKFVQGCERLRRLGRRYAKAAPINQADVVNADVCILARLLTDSRRQLQHRGPCPSGCCGSRYP